uniref:Uncharacterized protein n=1 Tax=Romanomermis culicivorax TaxID=13658 RepID=A0A915IE79_ROMCU
MELPMVTYTYRNETKQCDFKTKSDILDADDEPKVWSVQVDEDVTELETPTTSCDATADEMMPPPGLPMLQVIQASTWIVAFPEIPTTDNIRRGEVFFNREQAKFNVSKDYGFLVNDPQIRLKTLIEGWISKGFFDEWVAESVWRSFNKTSYKKARGGFSFNPGVRTWNSYGLVRARVAGDRLSAAYAFLILKHKGNGHGVTNLESSDLSDFVGYKNRKNLHEELADKLARFSIKYGHCRS